MTAAEDASAITNLLVRAPRGLRARLLAAVRPEFRVEVVFASPADPVLGGPACLVTGCERVARQDGFCYGHARLWKVDGKPDVALFAATTDPTIFTHRPYEPCLVDGCGYGRFSVRLCGRHHDSQRRSGFSDVQQWLKESAPTSTMEPRPLCRVQACRLWAEPDRPLCTGHLRRWRFQGQPDIEAFSVTVSLPTRERVDLRILEPHLRLEMQYVLQQRHDDPMGMVRLRPSELQKVFDVLADAARPSLLTWPDEEWLPFVKREVTPNIHYVRAFLTHAREQIENLQYGIGWDVEYPRSVWRLRNVGADTPGTAVISFTSIRQPWLVDIVKRWTRWRIGRGLHPATAGKGVRAVAILGRFLATRCPKVDTLSKVNRAILETFLADFHASGAKPGYRVGMISALGIFLSDIRRHRWDTTLPADAMFYPEDSPKLPKPLPRALAEHVMAQVDKPENLSLFGSPVYKLLTLILIRCGLRVTDGARLPFDCIVTDAESAPYLRYYNHKMKREALVPIDEELQRLIVEQQRRSLQQWPQGVPVLFPRSHTNREGRKALSGGTYRPALRAWLQRCDVRDELGPAGQPHAAPVASHLRHHIDQPRRSTRDRAAPPRP